ncbi:hypothetical protein [Aquisphaera insulae]|nr:hypothetical protein [Aquisphaera insulae]
MKQLTVGPTLGRSGRMDDLVERNDFAVLAERRLKIRDRTRRLLKMNVN